LINSR
ncbi:hypothetical protein CPC197_0835B, partial [Chlamydia psittaci C1/97]